MFLETSARTGENVEETFLKCARKILSKIETGQLPHVLLAMTEKCRVIFDLWTSGDRVC
jgi:GTPase SAR1 family protein